ncbi:MAG TPA: dienelactone hydrolase family protein [Anaerolineales bacterium]|nr:dienelactone hydrolase family protein [Anaerolineales bacterium]
MDRSWANQNPLTDGPHHGQPIRMAGELLNRAQVAMLMIHGRGASAEDILTLADQFHQPGVAYLAPQAANNTWYPNRFLVPLAENEPWLSSALMFVGDVFSQTVETGIPSERVILLGFSQGACLTLEFAARNARRFGGLVGLSGALIGPEDTPRDYAGSLNGTPVFLGCSDVDFHVPKERVHQTAEVLKKLGGSVTERLYPNMDHGVNQDEIEFVRGMMQSLIHRK